MAGAIKRRQPIRGFMAVAERPDGRRVHFAPFPTPIFNGKALAGAVSMLIDVSDRRQIEALREQAIRCRRLANKVPGTADILRAMADDYDAKAIELEQAKQHLDRLPRGTDRGRQGRPTRVILGGRSRCRLRSDC